MQIENKEFWEIGDVIEVQDRDKAASNHELFLFEKAKLPFARFYQYQICPLSCWGPGRFGSLEVCRFFQQPASCELGNPVLFLVWLSF